MDLIPSTSIGQPSFKKFRVEDVAHLSDSSDTEIENEDENEEFQLNDDEICAIMSQLPFRRVVELERLNKQWSSVSPRVTIHEVKLGSDLGLKTMSIKPKDALARIQLLSRFKGVKRINVETIKSTIKIKPVFEELGSFCRGVEEIVGSPENIEVSMNGYSIGAGLNQCLYSYVESVTESGNDNNIQVIHLQTRQFDPQKPNNVDEDIYELMKRCPRAKKLVLALTRMEVSKEKFLKAWNEFGFRVRKIHLYRGDQSVFDSFRNLTCLTEFKSEIRDLKVETVAALADRCRNLQSLSLACSAEYISVVKRFRNLRRIKIRIKSKRSRNTLESEFINLFTDEGFASNLTFIKLINHTQPCLYNLPRSVINGIASTCNKLRQVTLVATMEGLIPLDQLTTLETITIVNNGYSMSNSFHDLDSILRNNSRLKKLTMVRSFTGHPENEILLESMNPFLRANPSVKFSILLTHQLDSFEENWYRKMMAKHGNLSVQYKRII